LWSAVAVLVGSTLGSGIFRSPAGIADRLPGPVPLLAIWLTGGAFALCGALTLAELAGAMPRTGGIYVFVRGAWGRLPAFLFGWSELTMIRAASMGALSTTFAEYLLRVLGHDPRVAPYSSDVHF
jgi:amino acid transporter